MKKALTLLLALLLVLSLCACGDKRDVSGIGTLELTDKDEGDNGGGGVGTLGGSDGPSQTEEPSETNAPQDTEKLQTELYEDAAFSLTIPVGWTVESGTSPAGTFMVKVYNPANTNFCIMYYGAYEPLFPSDESRQLWSSQSDARYGRAPVITEPTAEQMLLHWNECADVVTAFEMPVSFPALRDVSVLSASTYEGSLAQYGATESEAAASFTSSNGAACGAYLCTAMILTDPQAIAGKDTRYYSSYENYFVMAPQESWENCFETLLGCIGSLSSKSASAGITAPGAGLGDMEPQS